MLKRDLLSVTRNSQLETKRFERSSESRIVTKRERNSKQAQQASTMILWSGRTAKTKPIK